MRSVQCRQKKRIHEKRSSLNYFSFISFSFYLFPLSSFPLPLSLSRTLPLPNVKGSGWCYESLLLSPGVFIYIFMPSKVPPLPLWRRTIEKHFSRYIARWPLTVKSMCRVGFPAVHLWLPGICCCPTHTHTLHLSTSSHHIWNTCTVHKPGIGYNTHVNAHFSETVEGKFRGWAFKRCMKRVLEKSCLSP